MISTCVFRQQQLSLRLKIECLAKWHNVAVGKMKLNACIIVKMSNNSATCIWKRTYSQMPKIHENFRWLCLLEWKWRRLTGCLGNNVYAVRRLYRCLKIFSIIISSVDLLKMQQKAKSPIGVQFLDFWFFLFLVFCCCFVSFIFISAEQAANWLAMQQLIVSAHTHTHTPVQTISHGPFNRQ